MDQLDGLRFIKKFGSVSAKHEVYCRGHERSNTSAVKEYQLKEANFCKNCFASVYSTM
jgi:hypothetical protein